jgi:GntR family transcriptional regulator
MIEIRLDTRSGVPYYRQIIDQILYGITSKKLKPGDQLPTVRRLAVELSINPNTVAKAYKELEILDILETQQGSGTFIADTKVKISDVERRKKMDQICEEFIAQAGSYGFTIEDILENLKERARERRET